MHTQAESYLVMSKDVIDEFVARTGYEGLQADMDEAAAQCPGDNVYKADTIKELAQLQGLDAAVFEATVERYNELCDKAVDEDFNKDAAELVPIKTAPFYIFRQDMAFWTSIGGIDTNRKMEVVTAKGECIPGLYAAGTDGWQPLSRNVHDEHSGLVQRQQLQLRPHRRAQCLRGSASSRPDSRAIKNSGAGRQPRLPCRPAPEQSHGTAIWQGRAGRQLPYRSCRNACSPTRRPLMPLAKRPKASASWVPPFCRRLGGVS